MKTIIPNVILLMTMVVSFPSIGMGSIDRDSTQSETTVQRRWYYPHYVPVQFAGNIGFLSTGIGYTARKDNYHLSLLYGYAPASIAGVRVHTVTAKNIFHIARFPVSRNSFILPYAAVGISIEVGGRSFLTLPDNMPDGYYNFPKSVHAIASLGGKFRRPVNHQFFRDVEFFAEVTTVDVNVWYKFISNEVKMHQILSLALGVNLMRR